MASAPANDGRPFRAEPVRAAACAVGAGAQIARKATVAKAARIIFSMLALLPPLAPVLLIWPPRLGPSSHRVNPRLPEAPPCLPGPNLPAPHTYRRPRL